MSSKLQQVNRRIGGLEAVASRKAGKNIVNRRIGGLEEHTMSQSRLKHVNRRIGGLEVS